MRKTRVKALKAALPRRIVRGVEIPPTKTAVRRAKRAYLRQRAGLSFATNRREARA